MPYLEIAFDNCADAIDRIVDDPTLGYKVLLALILSTKLPDARWKRKAAKLAESIFAVQLAFGESDFLYLKGLLMIQKLEIPRRVGSILFDKAGDFDPPVDSRLNCIHGIELRNLAQGCIMQEPSNLDEALVHLNKFKTQTWPSTMERHELDLQRFMRCKITRWQGRFEEAAEALKGLENRLGDRYDEIGCAFWSHYIGTLCELHQFETAERNARVALNGWLEFRETDILEERQKGRRLLRLTLAETLLSAGLARYLLQSGFNLDLESDLTDAASIFEDLDQEYISISTINWASCLEHLRVFLGRAIIAHLRAGRFGRRERSIKSMGRASGQSTTLSKKGTKNGLSGNGRLLCSI